jgi:hypothetical protein
MVCDRGEGVGDVREGGLSMSQLGKAVGDLVEVLMDWDRRLEDVEIAVADLDRPHGDARAITGKLVQADEWDRLMRLEKASRELVAWLGDDFRLMSHTSSIIEAIVRELRR